MFFGTIRYYDLVDVEAANEVLFDYYYNLYHQNRGSKFGQHCYDFAWNFTTFICYPCMEKALERRLKKSDLIGEHVPININFEKKVLGIQ